MSLARIATPRMRWNRRNDGTRAALTATGTQSDPFQPERNRLYFGRGINRG